VADTAGRRVGDLGDIGLRVAVDAIRKIVGVAEGSRVASGVGGLHHVSHVIEGIVSGEPGAVGGAPARDHGLVSAQCVRGRIVRVIMPGHAAGGCNGGGVVGELRPCPEGTAGIEELLVGYAVPDMGVEVIGIGGVKITEIRIADEWPWGARAVIIFTRLRGISRTVGKVRAGGC